ncbi:MFS transporter [Luteipulveratus halotolerans]|uniref:Membrane protein n=1 Tax=Luteipulveratus halotolerans TaxID=1631356 RepID=A0A0L6CMW3_9MICO|nr:MFS transporter [Luteipulveratus halotolerans]KNX38888.1 membrane protein [Luteipulveratus halotolerans]
MTTYREMFAIREFRILFIARLFTMIGVVVSNLALGTVMYDQTGSPLLTAISLFGGPLVQLVTARYLLASSDLMRPRTAMLFSTAVTTSTAALQLIPGLTWWMRFVILAAGYVALAATSGTVIALLSDIVPQEAFVLARATMNITVGGMQILGYGVGAVLLAAFSPSWLFAIAVVVGVVSGTIVRLGISDHPPRAEGKVVERSRRINRELLGSPVLRPLYLMMWVPNGLVVGCEALFIPYASDDAGYLFAAGAVGMLAGDVVIGRFIREDVRDRMVLPLRVLLAAPFLAFPLDLPMPVVIVLVTISAFGYPAALPLQERLVWHTPEDVRGQAFGMSGIGLMSGQAFGAAIAGGIAQVLDGPRAAGWAMAVMALLSLVTTAALTRGLARSAKPAPAVVPAT